jgi:hypothetical protein
MSKILTVMAGVVAAVLLQPQAASAHCDALDGPVVNAARMALDKNDVSLVLRWVPAEREADIRAAFDRAQAVRPVGGEAKGVAETWFFETLVRIHRAGEGAPFDGLKPAGHVEPFVAAVDRSLTDLAPDDVINMVAAHVTRGVRDRFARTRETKAKADQSIDEGRAYVAAYVDYLHYVEALLQAGATSVHHQESSGNGHDQQR